QNQKKLVQLIVVGPKFGSFLMVFHPNALNQHSMGPVPKKLASPIRQPSNSHGGICGVKERSAALKLAHLIHEPLDQAAPLIAFCFALLNSSSDNEPVL
ncbi:MAG: hypothetical protein RMK80_10075, partial [Pseudobdellovibrionaceae bacterium]|nr:hypothetical protein [Pseudobdellovibrionaceae bacterium]